MQGHFNPNQYNYLEANVSVHGRDKPILLVGRDSMNRAVAGDVVVVELLPESEWKGAADDVVDPDSALRSPSIILTLDPDPFFARRCGQK